MTQNVFGSKLRGTDTNDTQRYNDRLDEALDLHHITGKSTKGRPLLQPQLLIPYPLLGIAITGTIGIGLFINTGEFITIAGSLGTTIAFAIAGFIVGCVYVSLAEMVCLRPVPGALMAYPNEFVDESLGYTVGIIYMLV